MRTPEALKIGGKTVKNIILQVSDNEQLKLALVRIKVI